jgi:Transposase domain (DUF772)
MMGRQTVDQSQLFYLFNLEEQIPADHLLRRLNPIVTRVLVDLREKLAPFYSDIGRPSIDPELMIRMLVVGYCYGIRFERKLCEEVKLRSSASQLLWQSLTSRDRASSATAPRLPDADRRRLPNGRSRELPVPAQGASAHARFFDHAGSTRRSR